MMEIREFLYENIGEEITNKYFRFRDDEEYAFLNTENQATLSLSNKVLNICKILIDGSWSIEVDRLEHKVITVITDIFSGSKHNYNILTGYRNERVIFELQLEF